MYRTFLACVSSGTTHLGMSLTLVALFSGAAPASGPGLLPEAFSRISEIGWRLHILFDGSFLPPYTHRTACRTIELVNFSA